MMDRDEMDDVADAAFELQAMRERAEKAETERDTLRAQQDDADACIEALREDVERLRAQVEAARDWADSVEVSDSDDVRCCAADLLHAMDGATP